MGWLTEYLRDKRAYKQRSAERADDKAFQREMTETEQKNRLAAQEEQFKREQALLGQRDLTETFNKQEDEARKKADEEAKKKELIANANNAQKTLAAVAPLLKDLQVSDPIAAQILADAIKAQVNYKTVEGHGKVIDKQAIDRLNEEQKTTIANNPASFVSKLGGNPTPEMLNLASQAVGSSLSAVPTENEQRLEANKLANFRARVLPIPDEMGLIGEDGKLSLSSKSRPDPLTGRPSWDFRKPMGDVNLTPTPTRARVPVQIQGQEQAPVNRVPITINPGTFGVSNNRLSATPREVNQIAPIGTQYVGENIGAIPAAAIGLKEGVTKAFTPVGLEEENASSILKGLQAIAGVMPYNAYQGLSRGKQFLFGGGAAAPYDPDPNANLTQKRLEFLLKKKKQ